jgi:hypothetical protein
MEYIYVMATMWGDNICQFVEICMLRWMTDMCVTSKLLIQNDGKARNSLKNIFIEKSNNIIVQCTDHTWIVRGSVENDRK